MESRGSSIIPFSARPSGLEELAFRQPEYAYNKPWQPHFVKEAEQEPDFVVKKSEHPFGKMKYGGKMKNC
jgi:hypothetical protein